MTDEPAGLHLHACKDNPSLSCVTPKHIEPLLTRKRSRPAHYMPILRVTAPQVAVSPQGMAGMCSLHMHMHMHQHSSLACVVLPGGNFSTSWFFAPQHCSPGGTLLGDTLVQRRGCSIRSASRHPSLALHNETGFTMCSVAGCVEGMMEVWGSGAGHPVPAGTSPDWRCSRLRSWACRLVHGVCALWGVAYCRGCCSLCAPLATETDPVDVNQGVGLGVAGLWRTVGARAG